MNFKSVFSTLLIAASCAAVSAQTPSTTNTTTQSAHQRAHQEQLANVKKSKMDRTVVNDMLKDDISKRESESMGSLSAQSQQLIADILTEANRHMGKPYRHGMKGPNAFDCSGFTSYVYKQFGYTISPASRLQYNDGVSVDRKSLRKGDLVFFTSRSSGKNVGHVGMVVSANNETGEFTFIHASLKGVRISACEGYYARRYVGARRIITQ